MRRSASNDQCQADEANVQQVKEALKARFSTWSIVCSNEGRWWAFEDTSIQRGPGERGTVEADTPEELAAKIDAFHTGVSVSQAPGTLHGEAAKRPARARDAL